LTVVLLHALPLDERMWEPQRSVVPDAVAPRLYGRGHSMDDWARSLAAEVDGELVLVGASMGGYCALALGRRERQRVRAILLVGARPDADPTPERRAEMIDVIRREGPEGLWREMVPKLFADPGNADAHLLYRDSDGLVGAVEAIRDRADSTDVARAYGHRLRFVVGERENFASPGELSEFDIRVVPDAGHLVNLERPDAFNAELEEFLAGV
jgi:pimeloyl-ACP methyl ester carboxylesterase